MGRPNGEADEGELIAQVNRSEQHNEKFVRRFVSSRELFLFLKNRRACAQDLKTTTKRRKRALGVMHTGAGMQEAVRLKLPHGGFPGLGDKMAQEEVHGMLLLCVRHGIAVEAADRGHEVARLHCCVPVAPLLVEELAVSLAATILHREAVAHALVPAIITIRKHTCTLAV
jgi:hypothetical protein